MPNLVKVYVVDDRLNSEAPMLVNDVALSAFTVLHTARPSSSLNSPIIEPAFDVDAEAALNGTVAESVNWSVSARPRKNPTVFVTMELTAILASNHNLPESLTFPDSINVGYAWATEMPSL